MRQHIVLLVLGVLILQTEISLEVLTPRVAVIGGGIGGASASHFLTGLFHGIVQIDLYEEKIIGGRLKTVKIDGDEFEAGGSVIHPQNMYMQWFLNLLRLKKTTSKLKDIYNQHYAVWNGESLFLAGNLITMRQKLFSRYGFQPNKVKSCADKMIEDFKKIYYLQDAGQSFDNVTALLSVMNDFPKQLQTSTRNYLLHMGFNEKLINELVQAATVVNYGQEVDIQSFVGLISVAMANKDLWSVKGGNKRIPELLIYRNKNVNVVRGRVTKIRNLPNGHYLSQYTVTYLNKDSKNPMTSYYDIVIIAAPLTSDQEFPIKFVDFPDNLVFPGNYQTTYVTFVEADLNPEYIHLPQNLVNIFSCNPNKTKISSFYKVNTTGQIKKNSRVWKIVSREPIKTNRIHHMFSRIIEKKEIAWKAYPRYSTNINLDKFKLHHALYHVNAIEWAASTMEMSAIAGRNVAILAHENFLRKSYAFMFKKEASKNSTKNLRMSGEL